MSGRAGGPATAAAGEFTLVGCEIGPVAHEGSELSRAMTSKVDSAHGRAQPSGACRSSFFLVARMTMIMGTSTCGWCAAISLLTGA
jgi:hypothetical protein